MAWNKDDIITEQPTAHLRINNGVLEQLFNVFNHTILESADVWKPVKSINTK